MYKNCKCRRYCKVSGILIFISCLIAFTGLSPLKGNAQNEPQYEEISIFLNIQQFGGVDIPAVIQDENVYLPIIDIFTFLKIKNNPSPQLDSITGSFINPGAYYSIDRVKNQVTFQGKVYTLKSGDLIKSETNLYLNSAWFGKIFGLDCKFSFRSLSVILSTKLELPVIREMRLEQMRANISKLKGEIKTDTTIGRKYPAFHFGMADWSIISTQQVGGTSDNRINLALGTAIAGGEANAYLNYDNNAPFSEKQQQYMWRFVQNEQPLLRQISAGKIYSQVTSSIYNPIVGVQFTNTPTTYRRSFGTYTISDITEPNWIVELYVNNVLVDYMKADGSGFYKFEVPLVYGNSAVKLKFYGPWGEERIKEQNISIPFNFLPPKEFEYTISAGVVEDSLSSRFSRATLNYGVNRRLTIGGGVEYLSSVTTGSSMPFFNTSLRLFSGLMVTGEYTYGVRAKGILSYRLPSNLQFEINYAKYTPGQKAIIYNYLEERKAIVSIPIKGKNVSAYSRLTVNQIVLPGITNTNAEMLLSGSVHGITTNFTTYGLFTDIKNPFLYSNISLSFKLPSHITLTPLVQYEYNSSKLISARTSLEKSILKNGYLNISYEQNFVSNTKIIEMGLRYDLSFAQTGFSMRDNNDKLTMIGSARGSLLYDRKSKYLGTNNRNNVGKGAITLLPFLDINGNGIHDKGEPKIAGLQFKINGGTIRRNDKDTTIHVLDLTPYTSYFLELDKNSFDNLAWQMRSLSMKVNIDPNQFRIIEIPVAVLGEASGTVYNESRGQGRILVNFYKNDANLVARVMTESDGYYSYLGLKPGKYIAKIDPDQIKKLKMTSLPDQIPINIAPSKDGTILDGLDFHLSLTDKTIVKDTTRVESAPKPIPEIENRNIGNNANKEIVDKRASQTKDIQIQSKPNVAKPVEVDTVLHTVASAKIKVETPSIPKVKEKVVEEKAPANEAKVASSVTPEKTTKTEKDEKVGKAAQPEPKQSLSEVSKAKSGITNQDNTLKYPILRNRMGSIIQVGAFAIENNAINARESLRKITDHPIDIMFEDALFKVQISGFQGRKEGLEFIPKLVKRGFPEAFVVRTDRY